jgi:hypothetical protein
MREAKALPQSPLDPQEAVRSVATRLAEKLAEDHAPVVVSLEVSIGGGDAAYRERVER